MTEQLLERAILLMNQNRHKDAEKILNEILSIDPNEIQALCALTQVYLQLEQLDKAESIINNSIGLYPDYGYVFYLRAGVEIQKDQYDKAESDLNEAITLDPEEPDFFALFAQVKLLRKNYEEALNLANQALELEPDNLLALNVRSTSLLKLNRKDESFQTIEGALREDPNNSHTHTNYGWGLLEKGEHKKALVHFQEALKNNPSNEYAKAGMIEALKASNIVYRVFLKYSFWMHNLTANYQWGVIIGFYFGTKALRSIAQNNPQLQPILTPILILLTVFAFSTWIISPISNLLFRLSKYGKHLLDREEIISSNYVGISILVCLSGLSIYILTDDIRFIPIAIFGFAMMPSLGRMFVETKIKNAMIYYAGFMAFIGVTSIINTFRTGELFNPFSTIFIFGFIAYQWIANYLAIKSDNR